MEIMRQYIDELFPRYDEAGKELILKAYVIASEALKEHSRSNGHPFIEHPVAVAKIACDEIGLSAECIAAVFLHEATRFFPETDIMSAKFGQDVYTIVDGLNKIPGVYCPKPQGAFYTMAHFPVDDCHKFASWLLEEFSYKGATVQLAPAAGFYATKGKGTQEARIAYVLCKEDLLAACECLREALKVYPGRVDK
jgi:aspartate/methionine/tyrosine aminotransferase